MARAIIELVEQQRFVEALYFGGLRLRTAPESELAKLHLHMGLSCCAAVKPIAEVERCLMRTEPGIPPALSATGLAVGRSTHLVYEGVMHLVEARRRDRGVAFSATATDVASNVGNDLVDYMRQEFHGFASPDRDFPLHLMPVCAVILLARICNVETPEMNRVGNASLSRANDLIVAAGARVWHQFDER